MKTIKYLTMAALALMMTACSSDDNDIVTPDQPVKAEGIPFTATITVDNGATTRALAESGTTIEATWADNEQVALIYTVGSTAYKTDASVKAQGDGTATISATLQTGVATGDDVTIIYPASAADGTTGNVISNLLAAQDGTLTGTGGTSIAEKYDVRTGTGKLSISGGKATVNNGTPGTTVSLTNQNAIFKLTLKNIDATADVSATSVVISDQTGATLTTVTPAAGCDKVMYVALPTSATTLKFAVTGSDSKKYFNMASGLTLGTNFYQSTVKLATVGDVILSTGKCAKAGTAGAVAIIAYLGDGDDNITYNSGLAIAMSDANNGNDCMWKSTATDDICLSKNMTVSEALSNLNGIASTATLTSDGHSSHGHAAATCAVSNNGTAAPTGGCSGWFLPSMGQWQLIVQGLTGKSTALTYNTTSTNDEYKAAAVNVKIENAGVTGVRSNQYWSSTEYGAKFAWFMDFDKGNAYYNNKTFPCYVRACLAF